MPSKPHFTYDNFLRDIDDVPCYIAGLDSYTRNFSRDTLIAGFLAGNEKMIENQLSMSWLHQGKQFNPISGEEPGKIHHEYPGVPYHPPYMSTYNACDTTALYILGYEMLWHINQAKAMKLVKDRKDSINAAIGYLNHHVKDDIFWDFPPPPAHHYSVHTTYWKDSVVPDASGPEEPIFPVAFTFVQFQVARAFLAASLLLEDDTYAEQADRMYQKALREFMNDECFCIEQDGRRCLQQASSDELHALAYIPQSYKKFLPIAAIQERAKVLITEAGIACTPLEKASKLADTYHGYKVWIFEQAFIHYGASKFGLNEFLPITERCIQYIGDGQELLEILPKIKAAGNDAQLWSVAASDYFAGASLLRQTAWL